ncbi:unnamed protein product [Prorocentrum cordatum]|uniref:16S rRNA (uracil(1498)-N(3))-methyltransferase n=1 Tax=Prorocentrum cordatum TaxID=2364126 RepID=A0ABN9QRK1_9DINO|nr:unnamed protein product [Polarella glacialis]
MPEAGVQTACAGAPGSMAFPEGAGGKAELLPLPRFLMDQGPCREASKPAQAGGPPLRSCPAEQRRAGGGGSARQVRDEPAGLRASPRASGGLGLADVCVCVPPAGVWDGAATVVARSPPSQCRREEILEAVAQLGLASWRILLDLPRDGAADPHELPQVAGKVLKDGGALPASSERAAPGPSRSPLASELRAAAAVPAPLPAAPPGTWRSSAARRPPACAWHRPRAGGRTAAAVRTCTGGELQQVAAVSEAAAAAGTDVQQGDEGSGSKVAAGFEAAAAAGTEVRQGDEGTGPESAAGEGARAPAGGLEEAGAGALVQRPRVRWRDRRHRNRPADPLWSAPDGAGSGCAPVAGGPSGTAQRRRADLGARQHGPVVEGLEEEEEEARLREIGGTGGGGAGTSSSSSFRACEQRV